MSDHSTNRRPRHAAANPPAGDPDFAAQMARAEKASDASALDHFLRRWMEAGRGGTGGGRITEQRGRMQVDREHALAVKALERTGAELIVSARNDDSIDLSTHGKSVDRHLAVFRRRPARRP